VTTRTLRRGLDVLESHAGAGDAGLGPSAIGEAIDLDKATVSRLLATLAEAGYVRQDQVTRRYRLTAKILGLANRTNIHGDLRNVARPHLWELREHLGETVHLGVMEDLRIVYVEKMEARNSIQLVSRVGQTMPLHSTSLGKALLAALPEPEREAILGRIEYVSRTERTVRDADALRAEIDRVHVRGYATDDRENEPMGACVAAAIVGPDGRPVAAISVSGPHYRVRDHFETFGETVHTTANAVGAELGARPLPRGRSAATGEATPAEPVGAAAP
jgi:DNA-binding IclR family transcriptional regulator